MVVEYSTEYDRRHLGRCVMVPRHLGDIQLDLALRHPLLSYLDRIPSVYLEIPQKYLRGPNSKWQSVPQELKPRIISYNPPRTKN